MDDADWYKNIQTTLEAAYLASDDPRGQSGFRGDESRWERARRVIVEAIHRDGSFLDVGCANGLLMESMVAWARAKGHAIEPHGLDISAKLAALAQRRCPEWADRIYVGNAMTWQIAKRFDFVRTELVYVPEPACQAYVDHLLRHVVVPDGRLIVCSYGSSRRPSPKVEPIGDYLRAWGYTVAGEAEAADPDNGVVVTRVAWVDAAILPQL